MASTDSRPVPIKNTAYRAVFPIYDADGDLVTGAAGLDSEVSKDQGTFADCTNEATEIATSSGMYYLDLTSTEMNADCVAVIVKTSTVGAKTTVLVFYPQESGDIPVDIQSIAGSAVDTGSAQLGVNVVDKTGYALTSAYDFAKGTVAMSESYAANGAAPTAVQALYAIHQMLMQFAISGTSVTVKKLDNATTAFVVTLDDASNPTSAIRT